MWQSTTNLLKSVACPGGEDCPNINCLFNHELRPQKLKQNALVGEKRHVPPTSAHAVSDAPTNKRQKLEDGILNTSSRLSSLEDGILNTSSRLSSPGTDACSTTHAEYRNLKVGIPLSGSVSTSDRVPAKSDYNPPAPVTKRPTTGQNIVSSPASLSKVVTPPSTNKATSPLLSTHNATNGSSTAAKTRPQETLNPRLLPSSPADHGKRTVYLKYIHAEMVRLNNEVKLGNFKHKELVTLSDDELITWALDEECDVAKGNASIYENVIKNRIATYKKMKTNLWVGNLRAKFDKSERGPDQTNGKVIDTGLSLDEEHYILPKLVLKQTPELEKHDYIFTPPSDQEAAEAAAAVHASLNYEVCDRCAARFRVFPERDAETGALTSNGTCTHHWGKKYRPPRQKTDHITGAKPMEHSCCRAELGSPGCVKCEHHVFSAKHKARLHAVLPFIITPDNAKPASGANGRAPKAVTFDCEMGYTTLGMELIRLTAVSWPHNEPLVDVLVRPLGIVLDLNTRFSGVKPEDMTSAIPYPEYIKTPPHPPPGRHSPGPTPPPTKPLPIVDTPQEARALLCSFLTPATPLLGHAIENDLAATRLCHPTLIDTAMLYPAGRPLPIRNKLKALALRHLGRSIQTGGAEGHDSLEDATATGDLVRVKVAERWVVMRGAGYRIGDGALLAPLAGAGGYGGDAMVRMGGKRKAEDGCDGTHEADACDDVGLQVGGRRAG